MSGELGMGLLSSEPNPTTAAVQQLPKPADSESQDIRDPADHIIKRADGTTWTTTPVNTWLLYKLFVTLLCILSLCEALGNFAALVVLAVNEAWLGFGLGVGFLVLSSCITSVGGIFLAEPHRQLT